MVYAIITINGNVEKSMKLDDRPIKGNNTIKFGLYALAGLNRLRDSKGKTIKLPDGFNTCDVCNNYLSIINYETLEWKILEGENLTIVEEGVFSNEDEEIKFGELND
jgi:hypothetical protein